MGIPLYLAMTALELRNCDHLPEHMAWMACHFSSYGTGLCNMPASLPPKSMIILNDRTPIYGHDPQVIAEQLLELKEKLDPACYLLDFQRPDSNEISILARTLVEKLPCPVGVSELYALDLPCPVFLAPPKPNVLLAEYFSPWKDREIWLEAALENIEITVNGQGAAVSSYSGDCPDLPFSCDTLHCHYGIELCDDLIRFRLSRQKEDLMQLLSEVERLGIQLAVGLYQQIK